MGATATSSTASGRLSERGGVDLTAGEFADHLLVTETDQHHRVGDRSRHGSVHAYPRRFRIDHALWIRPPCVSDGKVCMEPCSASVDIHRCRMSPTRSGEKASE